MPSAVNSQWPINYNIPLLKTGTNAPFNVNAEICNPSEIDESVVRVPCAVNGTKKDHNTKVTSIMLISHTTKIQSTAMSFLALIRIVEIMVFISFP